MADDANAQPLMTMVPHEAARAIAVLHFAVGVCRGMLYSASFGDAEKGIWNAS
jgi:hypothetical protein